MDGLQVPFGLQHPGLPRFPADRLIGNRARVNVATVAPVLEARAGHAAIFTINDHPLCVVRDCRGRRRWVCPKCQKLVVFVYFDEFWCQKCAGLDWPSRHVAADLPIHRIICWRRQLAPWADPEPFGAIRRNPHARKRFQQTCRRIWQAEAELVAALAKVNDDLEARLGRMAAAQLRSGRRKTKARSTPDR